MEIENETDDDLDFVEENSEFMSDEDLASLETPQESEEVDPPAEPTPAEPIQDTPPSEPVPVEPPKEPEAPAEPTPEPQVAEAPKGPTLEDWQKNRAVAEAELASKYTFSEEDAQALITEPETVLPKLASKLYFDIYESVLYGVYSMLPQAIQGIQLQETSKASAEQEFFAKWGALNKPEYRDLLLRTGKAYRQLNPSASKEQFIDEVGLTAMVALKLPLDGIASLSSNAPSASPPRQMGMRQPVQPGTPPSGNTFETLAEEFISDD